MIIDFKSMDLSVLPEFKGGEKQLAANMFFDGTNRIFKGRLIPGATIGMHTHDDSCEVIFILEGCGTILEREPGAEVTDRSVGEGDCLYCPKGHAHSLQNTAAKNMKVQGLPLDMIMSVTGTLHFLLCSVCRQNL